MSRPGRSTRVPLFAPAVLLHAASWFAMVAHGTDWTGAWMNAVDAVAGSVIITGPLVAGLTANTYARLRLTALPDLVVASVQPVREWYEPALRFWSLAVVNLVVLLGEAAVLVAVAGPHLFGRALLILPISSLVLAAHVLVGMAIGLNLGPRIAGAVAGTVSFGLFLLSVARLAPDSFNAAGAGSVLVGEQYRAPVLLALGAMALTTAIAIASATGWNARFRRSRFLLAALGIAGAMALSSGDLVDLDNRYESVRVPLTCRGSDPQVCVPADAPRSLAAAASGMHRFSEPLLAAGVELPARWVYSWGQRQPRSDGRLRLYDRVVLGSRVPTSSLVDSLTLPAWCADGGETERILEVRLLLAHWIGFRNGMGRGHSSVPASWFASSPSEAWVRATYAKLRRCDLAALTFPTKTR